MVESSIFFIVLLLSLILARLTEVDEREEALIEGVGGGRIGGGGVGVGFGPSKL